MSATALVDVIIMAAGKGTRMRSTKPKVLQPLAGRPLLAHVLSTIEQLFVRNVYLIYGFGGEQVQQTLASHSLKEKLTWVEQVEQLGTGHAVQQVLPYLSQEGYSLILSGDVPLISKQTLEKLYDAAKQGLALVTLIPENANGYGRIIRNAAGHITGIIEHKDADAEQLKIKEINTGIYCVKNSLLQQWLPLLNNHNAQQEYYLTDIVGLAAAQNIEIGSVMPQLDIEVEGVNDRQQLASLECRYQHEQVKALMAEGVHVIDPFRVDIRGTVQAGQDVEIDINVIFEGNVVLGDRVKVGAHCILKNVTVGAGTIIQPFSLLDDSVVDENAVIGPYARLRPGTHVQAEAHVGNFVELKNTTLGAGSKANHLAYLGDATIGQKANVGAGTITCNYDGVNKFKTFIGDGAFIGSNSSLVAPVTIGHEATVGAGSVITKDVPDQTLGVARGVQRNVNGWKRPVKKS